MQKDKAACVQKTHNFLYCFSNSEMLSSICSDTLWIASCLRGLMAGHFNFSVVISPFTLYKTYQCQVSIDLQDGNRSFLHRLLSATSWLPSLCIPQQCGSHEEEAGLRMWLEYPIQPHWNLHEARVCTDHSGIWWIKTQWHSCRWLKQKNICSPAKQCSPDDCSENLCTWECCFLGLRCHWRVHQTGSICCQPVKSCGQDEGKEGGHSSGFLLLIFSIPICWPVAKTTVEKNDQSMDGSISCN